MNRSDDASRGQVVLYQATDGVVQLEVRLERESLWLSRRQMAVLFDKDSDTIGLHLRNVFKEGELQESATTEESSVVQQEGSRQVRRKVRLYNLDAIISVGYRVNSIRGTQFRIWATRVLRDHVLQGYTINQARLKDLNRAVRLIADTEVLTAEGLHLESNDALISPDGRSLISNETLVAVTLLIAESRPAEKDVLVRIVTHLLCHGESE